MNNLLRNYSEPQALALGVVQRLRDDAGRPALAEDPDLEARCRAGMLVGR